MKRAAPPGIQESMRVVSLNVGRPRDVAWHGKTVRTSIFKTPVEGRRAVRELNIDGDEQADLGVHGGVDKAVYVYPAEHYAYWRNELPGMALPWGAFGENLTVEGLQEAELAIGDRLRIGSAAFAVTQPRMPCFKLGIRFDRADMVKRFMQSGRSGFYLAVLQEGELGAGDAIEHSAGGSDVTVSDIVTLYAVDRPHPELLRRAIATAALPESWREYFRGRL